MPSTERAAVGPRAASGSRRPRLWELGVALACKWTGWLARLQVWATSRRVRGLLPGQRDSCLKAVTAVVGDRDWLRNGRRGLARAWTSWGKVRRYTAPRAWVVRTALNLGVSWWRRRHREVPLADHDAAAPADPGDGVDPR